MATQSLGLKRDCSIILASVKSIHLFYQQILEKNLSYDAGSSLSLLRKNVAVVR